MSDNAPVATGPEGSTDGVAHLVTHSGGFHADELLASVVLTQLHPQASIIRSRDPAWITPAPDRIVYDVGGAFDPDRAIFDHHQRPAPARDDGQPYSAFGLIWQQFGRAYLRALDVPDSDLDAIHADFDAGFVRPIDAMDNGTMDPSVAGPMAELTLPALLESLVPVFDARGDGAEDRAFAAALPLARQLVEAAIAKRAAKRRAAGIVARAIDGAGASRVLELPTGLPFREGIETAGADHLLFVIHPRGSDWALTTIQQGADTFRTRADLPADWAGLTGDALEAATGVAGAKFCHAARFLAIATDRDAVMKLADLAVAAAR